MALSKNDRWNASHYKQMKFSTPPLVADNFKSACETNGVSMASVIINFMRAYSASAPAEINKFHTVNTSTRRLRRKELRAVIDTVSKIHKAELGSLDNIPENFRDADTYADTENIVEALETAIESLNEVYAN